MTESIISARGLTKRFGDVHAVDELTIDIENGVTFGLLGPNGAGKSTFIDMMLGYVSPSGGKLSVHQYDPRKSQATIRSKTGVVPDAYGVYDSWTGRRHVEYSIEAKGATENSRDILERVGLSDAIDRMAGGYSKGMKQRLLLAMAIVGDPSLLILDEPSTGLDPNGMRIVREIIEEERANGTTVFFSSHRLSQIQAVCDRIGVIVDGQMKLIDDIETIQADWGRQETLSVKIRSAPALLQDHVSSVRGVEEIEIGGSTVRVTCTGRAKKRVLDAIQDSGAIITNFWSKNASLEYLLYDQIDDSGISYDD